MSTKIPYLDNIVTEFIYIIINVVNNMIIGIRTQNKVAMICYNIVSQYTSLYYAYAYKTIVYTNTTIQPC